MKSIDSRQEKGLKKKLNTSKNRIKRFGKTSFFEPNFQLTSVKKKPVN